MSKASQMKLNLELSEKLADYLITKPELLKKYSGCSYVVFSSHNATLNKLNEKLIQGLLSEGNIVVRVNETGNIKNPWIFNRVLN